MFLSTYKHKLLLLLLLLVSSLAWSQPNDESLLIISSYNPSEQQTSRTITDFIDEFEKQGGEYNIIIENLNCKNFAGVKMWKSTMEAILHKYNDENAPSLILLLGQEAFISFLSVDKSLIPNVKVVTGLVSKNVVLLPDEDVDIATWMPQSLDFIADSLGHGVINSGFLYEYDIASNIELIRSLYPSTKHIAFISDNTYGGVNMQALVRKEMEKHPDINLIQLDGRVNTIYTLIDQIKELPQDAVIMIGTWRIDKNEGYFMRNATYSMMEANPNIPVFSPATVALGHWAIGGVVPNYRSLGKDLAYEALMTLKNNDDHIEVISSKAVVDHKKLHELNLDINVIPFQVEIINQPPTFYESYKWHIWAIIAILFMLGLGLAVSLFYFFKTKRLKDKLEVSEVELREAKEAAEESNRLKSAFLANMSHEIRTPLNAIVGFTDVLSSIDVSKEELKDCNEIIKSNSDLLLRLINDILDLSRLESGRVSLEFENCDVVKLCQQALSSVEYSCKSNNTFHFTSDYPSFNLKTDVQRMQQVLINLLSNACKFTQNGNVELFFTVDTATNMAMFTVTDTGVGIPKGKENSVFDRFEKLSEHAQGTGLGLSICKLTVEKWNGSIWVDTSYTDGARFIFSHPLI